MRKLTEFRADSDYRLWLRFDDGLEGSVFLGNLLEIGAFKIWRDQDQFRRVAIDPAAMTLVWDGGIELDPVTCSSASPHEAVRICRQVIRPTGVRPGRLDNPGYRSRVCSSCFSLTLMKELYHGNEEKSKESSEETG